MGVVLYLYIDPNSSKTGGKYKGSSVESRLEIEHEGEKSSIINIERAIVGELDGENAIKEEQLHSDEWGNKWHIALTRYLDSSESSEDSRQEVADTDIHQMRDRRTGTTLTNHQIMRILEDYGDKI